MKYTVDEWYAKYEEFMKITCNGDRLDEMMRPYTKKLWDGMEVGDGVTVHLYTDRQAYTIIKRTKNTLTLRRCKRIRAKSFTPEWEIGGFSAICTNNEDQEWEYEEDEKGKIEIAHWSEKQCCFYVDHTLSCSVGRHEFYDYNF